MRQSRGKASFSLRYRLLYIIIKGDIKSGTLYNQPPSGFFPLTYKRFSPYDYANAGALLSILRRKAIALMLLLLFIIKGNVHTEQLRLTGNCRGYR